MTSVNDNRWWSLHTHSKFSVNDALPTPEQCVEKAVQLGYPAIGLTDHGSISGSIALYKAARKLGIEPLPGIELYVCPDTEYAGRKDNVHLTIAAYTETGYRNLVSIATRTAMKFWYRPRIDLVDFAEMSEAGTLEGLVVTTGCHFGLLPQLLMKQGPQAAAAALKALDSWFPKVYVELQNHGIGEEQHRDETDATDDDVVEGLWSIATEVGVPVIVTRDSHYVNREDRHLHEALKRMVSWSEDVDDAVFPGDGYHMTDEAGMRPFFEPHVLDAGLDSLVELASLAQVRLPEMETFTLKVPDVEFDDPQGELDRLVWERFHASKFASNLPAAAAVETELVVINTGGMAPYLLFVNIVCEYMREHGIGYHARGSAVGSMVNYLLGITQIDPMRYGLRFDRFLSHNRMKPPDVDLDVEHRRRKEVHDFIDGRWAVRACGSLMKYSLEEDEETEESKGSLRVRFYSTLRKRGIDATAWKDIPRKDRDELMALSRMRLISGYGTHAAGIIVASTEADVERLPLAKIAGSSGHLVTAYDKKDVERMGYTKLDLLGSRTRTAIEHTTRLAGVNFEEIPEDDRSVFEMINNGYGRGRGNVDGVFTLAGWTMRKWMPQLKPQNINDLILAQALFRPAAINSGATKDYLARRNKRAVSPVRHADIMAAAGDTFGVLVYQEQVMDVMESLGMGPIELETMLDAVKASNEYTAGAALAIEQAMPRIKELANDRGWSADDIRWLTDSLHAYADYSFNKAHAASYGTISYRCAWLKRHYPLEFWVGMLDAYADASRIKDKPHPTVGHIMSARRDHVKIYGPHVNRSQASFVIDPELRGIRKGLTTVRGVGPVAARELVANAPYDSLLDLGKRVLPSRVTGAKHLVLGSDPTDAGGHIAALYDANALRGLT